MGPFESFRLRTQSQMSFREIEPIFCDLKKSEGPLYFPKRHLRLRLKKRSSGLAIKRISMNALRSMLVFPLDQTMC
jgi:hypothetical protein